MSAPDTERLRSYLERQLAECDRIIRAARHPEPRAVAAEERRELQERLDAIARELQEVAA